MKKKDNEQCLKDYSEARLMEILDTGREKESNSAWRDKEQR